MKALLALLVALLGWIAPAAAAPTLVPTASRGRITVYAEPGLEDTASLLASNAEAALERIRADLVDLPSPQAIEVRLVRDARDLAEVAPAGRGAPEWAVGVAYPDLGIISVAMRRGAAAVDPLSTLKHELGHIALGVAIAIARRTGCMRNFAYQDSGEWSWARTETLRGHQLSAASSRRSELDRIVPAQEASNCAYAQSYDFVGYLSRRGRWEDKQDDGDRWAGLKFFTAVGQTAIDAAVKARSAVRSMSLFEEWRSRITTRYMLVPIGLFGLAVWIVCAILLALAFVGQRRQEPRGSITAGGRSRAAEDEAIAKQIAALTDPPPSATPPPLSTERPGDSPDAFSDDDFAVRAFRPFARSAPRAVRAADRNSQRSRWPRRA